MTNEKHSTVTPEIVARHEELWDVKRVAKYLRVSANTVRRRVKVGTIPFHRVGPFLRFDPAEIAEWVRRGDAALPEPEAA